MKLHYSPRTRAARVRWLLLELGVPHELNTIDVFTGEGRKAEHLALHPHGFVPALEEEGIVLIESAAICMHLADRYGDGKLAPPLGTLERGKYYEWMVYVPAMADPCLETIMFHTVFLPEHMRVSSLVERARKRWKKVEARFASAVASQPFILGEQFSAADVLVGSTLAWSRAAGAWGDDPALSAYAERLESRPAFIEAHSS
ncbi:MAG: glutathione S-transferase family protein [Myxococcales bacterium]|nr:glutathione S-transferase family protein [Myxococcales bacterium]